MGFKRNEQKATRVKNVTFQYYEILTRKSGFKVKKKVKYLGVTLTNLNYFKAILHLCGMI